MKGDNIFKKWYFYLFLAIIIALFFSLRGCETDISISKDVIEESITSALVNRQNGANSDISSIAESVTADLAIDLEPLDFACIMGEEDCLVGCFETEFVECLDTLEVCEDECDEEFPATDETFECWDGCWDTLEECCDGYEELELSEPKFVNFVSITPSVYAIAEFECPSICYDELYECEDVCDADYIECADECVDEFAEPCVDLTVDCIYVCLEECMIGEELYVWDGSEVTDIGDFYETNFPEFDGQFNMVCEWLLMGDIVSNENKYGCEDIGFIGDWISPLLRSIDSMEVVCETIGGTFINEDGETSCNI